MQSMSDCQLQVYSAKNFDIISKQKTWNNNSNNTIQFSHTIVAS
jgi:hypothetical protein